MNKLIRDNKVAVLYSPEFGAGWSTWNSLYPEMIFDPVIVQMVEDNTSYETIILYCEQEYPEGYFGGASDLQIAWININREFVIVDNDGAESFIFKDAEEWIKA
jgi:hypothetical protein